MYPKNLKDIADPGVRKRMSIERQIVLALIDLSLAEGYELAVNDGEEQYAWTRDRDEVIADIMNTDSDWLYRRKGGQTAWVHLVYGNDGWDVICDYSTSLEALLEPINALASGLEDAS